MRQVSLREFRTRGAKALAAVPKGETVLLAGQQGPAYFLVPAMGDLAAQDKDLRLALARASLRESAVAAAAFPITDEEIEREIQAVRAERATRAGQAARGERRMERKKKIA
jgi:antitoxin (DNA-binding transcriptional repressor) of toxin-antitoxin stability system